VRALGLLDELGAAVLVRNVALGLRDFAKVLSQAAIEGARATRSVQLRDGSSIGLAEYFGLPPSLPAFAGRP
jgi:hypothetical protein